MKCLSDNAYQNSECGEFFDAYNRCKQEWVRSYVHISMLCWLHADHVLTVLRHQ